MKRIFILVSFFCLAGVANIAFAQSVKINHNGTNGLTVESDGTIKFDGTATVFDDMFADITKVKVQGTGLTSNEAELTIDFSVAAQLDDYAIVVYQMSHKWKGGSPINPHFHWVQASNSVPNFLIQYRWQKNGQSKTTAWTNHKCNTSNAFIYSSGSLNQITFGADIISPANYGISDVIQVRILRDTQNASGVFTGLDPYSGTVAISSVDFHFEIDTEGSRTEYGK